MYIRAWEVILEVGEDCRLASLTILSRSYFPLEFRHRYNFRQALGSAISQFIRCPLLTAYRDVFRNAFGYWNYVFQTANYTLYNALCGFIPLTIFLESVGKQSGDFKLNSSYDCRVYIHFWGHFKSECLRHVRKEDLQF